MSVMIISSRLRARVRAAQNCNMRTDIDCLGCFKQQALATARVCGLDKSMQRRVVDEIARLLPLLDCSVSPPENAVAVYGRIAEITGISDPFSEIKKKGNRFAADLKEEVRRRITATADPLYSAVRFAIAANIIDYGSQHEFDALATMETCLDQELCIDDYGAFRREVNGSSGAEVLYLADNCGEIVFDGLLIEQLQVLGCQVTLAVRGAAILNDATRNDVLDCSLDGLCRVITSGTGCPGTPLRTCGPELGEAFARADLVISKGQGNFETLSEVDGPLFFMLTVKCPVVARHIADLRGDAPETLKGKGEMILMQQRS